jgi:lipopolysaccharide export system protein LptA
MRTTRLALAAVCLGLVVALPLPALAQGFAMSRSGDQQIQVYADNGIEWDSENARVIARGNAHAVRGTMTIDADMLTAHYRKGKSGDEIWRLDADGSVVIRSPTDTATGAKAIYDLDKAVFLLKGSPARLVTPTDKYQADDVLEYWEIQKMAVLRGNAVATRGDKTLKGDVLTAYFKDKSKGKAPPAKSGAKDDGGLDLERAEAFGHVVLTAPTETVTGDRGDYNADSGIATVSGSVKITREGGNQLEGGWAYVNLNTGISKLFPGTPGKDETGQRVQGVFTQKKKDQNGGRAGFSAQVPSVGDAIERSQAGEAGGRSQAGESGGRPQDTGR